LRGQNWQANGNFELFFVINGDGAGAGAGAGTGAGTGAGGILSAKRHQCL